jgi:hypothetical protein
MGPGEFDAFLRAEIESNGRMVRALKLVVE